MSGLPVSVSLTSSEDLPTVTGWLCDPAIYQDAFALPAEPDPAWLKRSMLVVMNGHGKELQPVRIWSVHHTRSGLIGLGIDYGWDGPEDTVREVDLALPRSDHRQPRLYMYAVGLMIHQLFREYGATEIMGHVRAGASGRGFPRLYAALGGQPTKMIHDPQVGSKGRARIRYWGTRETFFASPFVQKLLQRAENT